MNQPDLDLLADYVGGALDGTPEATEVGERIRTDIAWAAAHAQLVTASAEVSTHLRGLGEQAEPMPPEVWARLEAALLAEEPLPTAEFSGSAGHAPAGKRPAPVDNRPAGRAAARRRRWVPVLVGLAIFAALGLGVSVLRPLTTGSQDSGAADKSAGAPAAGPATPVLAVSTGRDYTENTLVQATDFGNAAALSKSEAAEGTYDANRVPTPLWSLASPVPTELSRLAAPEALNQCLQAVSGTIPGDVVGVDFARYAGAPALIVVIRAADDARWVGVTGPDCGLNGPDLRISKRVA
jgi:hypothetical protein